MLRVLEVGGQTIPVVTPAFDDNRIVLAPFDFKIVESLFGRILINGLVYEFQIPHELFLPLAGHILDRVAYLVYNAELNRSLRKDTCNRIWKSLEPVNTGDEDILDSSVLEIRKDAEPEVGPLAEFGSLFKPMSKPIETAATRKTDNRQTESTLAAR